MISLGPRKGRFKIDDKEQNRATTGSQNGVRGRSQNKPRDNRTTSMLQEVMGTRTTTRTRTKRRRSASSTGPTCFLPHGIVESVVCFGHFLMVVLVMVVLW